MANWNPFCPSEIINRQKSLERCDNDLKLIPANPRICWRNSLYDSQFVIINTPKVCSAVFCTCL